MKKIVFLFAVLLSTGILTSFISTPALDPALIGKWKSEERSMVDEMTLDKEGYATFVQNGIIWGGKSSEVSGTKISMTYEVIPGTIPKQINFIISYVNSTKQVYKLEGIYDVMTPKKLRLCLNSSISYSRPDSFANSIASKLMIMNKKR